MRCRSCAESRESPEIAQDVRQSNVETHLSSASSPKVKRAADPKTRNWKELDPQELQELEQTCLGRRGVPTRNAPRPGHLLVS